jgi:Ferritin-like domain
MSQHRAASVAVSRDELLQRAVVAGGALAAGGVLLSGLPDLAASAPSRAQDVRILNFALWLEYAQAAFYSSVEDAGALTGEAMEFAQVVGAHERKHVAFLKKTLGKRARKEPTFDFGEATRKEGEFLTAAHLLEETGVAAYIGQAPNLTRRLLIPTATIVSVEARHAAWIRDILGRNPAPLAADAAKEAKQVVAAIKRTGFIRS